MHPIRFKPFIGKNFEKQDFKVLVLGESHYLNENDLINYLDKNTKSEAITNNVLNDYIEYKKTGLSFSRWMNTFTKFSNVISGRELNSKETVDFWESCAFYNYVQVPTPGTRISPSKVDFSLSMEAFKEVINQYKPNIIIFWGYRLWNNFPKEEYTITSLENSQIHYLTLNGNVPILSLPHPSTKHFNKSLSENIATYISAVKDLRKS